MPTQHDFEIQIGHNQAFRGRGWMGLIALTIVMTGFLVLFSIAQQ